MSRLEDIADRIDVWLMDCDNNWGAERLKPLLIEAEAALRGADDGQEKEAEHSAKIISGLRAALERIAVGCHLPGDVAKAALEKCEIEVFGET